MFRQLARAYQPSLAIIANGRFPLLPRQGFVGFRFAQQRFYANGTFNVCEITSDGQATHKTMSRGDLLELLPVAFQPRDFHVIDSSYRSQGAVILPKQNHLLVHMEFVKAICLTDRAIIFDSHRVVVQNFVDAFVQELKEPLTSDFEFRFLDTALDSICTSFEAQYRRLTPILSTVTGQLSLEVNEDSLHVLLPLTNSISEFEYRIKDAAECVQSLLNSDEDMAALFLTKRSLTGVSRPVAEHEEAELLLESYARQLDDASGKVLQMKQEITNSKEIVALDMDRNRNRIIRLNLFMTMSSLSLSTIGVTAGIFGMNLVSGLEAAQYAFPIVTGVSALSAVGILAFCVKYYRGTGVRTSAQRALISDFRALGSLLQDLDDIEEVLRKCRAQQKRLTEREMKSLLEQTTGRDISSAQVKLIYCVYDLNNDGALDFSEYLSAAGKYALQHRHFATRWKGNEKFS
eukprot:TRINITY_DN12032_c0_g1_i1.p1 TRINITY_DN12032_c0_g1~~TRINITY_DN12032_c0_g1_i1.p1  ORF type:complete len:461 (-),score=100.09 TRINITY_DN12032_c0_g1_i1:34-1416(-)